MIALLQSIVPWADLWIANLWRASWQGAIAIAIAWVLVRSCTFLSPRIVCWIWRLVCLKLLVVLIWVQPLPIPLLPITPLNIAIVESALSRLPASEPVLEMPLQERMGTGTPALTLHKSFTMGYSNWLFFLWLSGFCYQIVVFVRQWSSVRKLSRWTKPALSIALQQVYRSEAERLAVRRLPRLRLSLRHDGPLLVGILRPTIVLPSHAEAKFDRIELGLMLAHEFAHLNRHDLLWNWLLLSIRSMFFFHPFLWVVTKCWSESQEAACDEVIIQRKVASLSDYGRLLLKLSTCAPRNPDRSFATAGILGTYRNLKSRILAMSHIRPISRARLAVAVCMVILIAAIGIVPWQLTAQGKTTNEVNAEVPATSGDAGKLIERIYSSYDSQRKEVGTAKIKFRLYRNGMKGAFLAKTPAETAVIFHKYNLASDPNGLADMLRELQVEAPPPAPFARVTLTTDGNRVREDFEDGDVHIFDGQQHIKFNAKNRQIDLRASGNLVEGHLGLSDFRWLPKYFAKRTPLSIERDGDRIRIKEELIDHGLPMVQRVETEQTVDGAGNLYGYSLRGGGKYVFRREIMQAGHVSYPGGIVFPTVRITAQYTPTTELLRSLEVCLISEAEFNQTLPEDAFVIGAAEGTHIINWGEKAGKPKRCTLKERVSDVVDIFKNPSN